MTYPLYSGNIAKGKRICVCEQELRARAHCGCVHNSQETHLCKCPPMGDGQTDMLSLNGEMGTLSFVPEG